MHAASAPEPRVEIVENVACTVCGCVCDDLRITVEDGKITRAERACGLAEPWFLEQDRHHPPAACVNGQEVELETALHSAADLLRRARAPLVYGLSRSSTEGQRAVVALADRIGAIVDTTASLCHAPSILAYQQVGESTCSLGEAKNRCDLVIYWGCDPQVTHPRHFERYGVDPIGQHLPRGRADRTVIVADTQPTASSALADLFLPLEKDGDFDALWTLRALIRGKTPPPGVPTGAPRELLEQIAAKMRSCRSGIVFFGLGLSQTGIGHLNVVALLSLVRDLHQWTRFYARRMRIVGDVAGADSLLCWQTGYPFSVSLAREYPRYNPGEFSAQDLLERGEVDLCLFLGSEGAVHFSQAARDRLRTIPVIALDHAHVESTVPPTVRFTTSIYGIHHPGTAYRMDETPIPLKRLIDSPYPTDHAILYDLTSRL